MSFVCKMASENKTLEQKAVDDWFVKPCPNNGECTHKGECTHEAKCLPGPLCGLQVPHERFCNRENNNGHGFKGDVPKRWAEFLTETMTTLNEFVKSHPENPQKLRRFLKGFLWVQTDRCVFTIDELEESYLRGDYQNA